MKCLEYNYKILSLGLVLTRIADADILQDRTMKLHELRLMVVGDRGVGKYSLLHTYSFNEFPDCYFKYKNKKPSREIVVKDKTYVLHLHDIHGKEAYDVLRPLLYPGKDIVLLCYSVDNRTSFENIKEKWFPEVNHCCPQAVKIVTACKTDLRATSPHSGEPICYEEGFALAKSFKAGFCELSSLTRECLDECFQYAVEIVDLNGVGRNTPEERRSSKCTKSCKKTLLIPPFKPPSAKAPVIEIEMSTFGDDWYSALQDPTFHDVTFIVEGKRRLYVHRIVLCAASLFFNKLLAGTLTGPKTQEQELSSIDGFSTDDLNSGKIKGISAVYEKDESDRLHVVIELSADIQAKTFLRILEFLYTGVPRLPDDVEETELNELRRVAELFKLSYLVRICTSIIGNTELPNVSMGKHQNGEMSSKMRKMFLNKESAHSDVVFNVEGSKVFAHKVVLCTRSQVMAAMFSGNFMEGNSLSEINIKAVSLENFLALLEYLYTDYAPIERINDIVGLLCLADEKGIHRLVNLCELYIVKEMERGCGENQIKKANIDVIGVLNTARMVNANQLAEWCLHFVSTNYTAFSKCKEFSHLTPEDRSYINEHRWPPLSYVEEKKVFEKKKRKLSGHGHKCCF